MSIERTFKRTILSVFQRLLPSTPASLPAPEAVQKILVVRQHNQLGDMLCAVPLLRGLRATFPNAHVTLVASPVNIEVMQHNRYLDEIILFDKKRFLTPFMIRPLRVLGFLRDLRRRRFDFAIVPATVSTSVTSDLLAYASGAPTRLGAGSIDAKENPSRLFFTLRVPLDWRLEPHRHQVLRHLDIASRLGVRAEDLSTEITLTDQERLEGREQLGMSWKPGEIGIALHPGAGKVPNRWPAWCFASVANILVREFHARLFITCGPMDDDPVDSMVSKLTVPCTLIKGKDIRTVAAMLSHLQLVVTNDTGIMHVAAAVKVPVLSLFGPTDPRQWAPIGSEHRYIQGGDGTMDAITVDQVVAAAGEILRAPPLEDSVKIP
jgi:ADP-heptose:LPS heptosyltransferase